MSSAGKVSGLAVRGRGRVHVKACFLEAVFSVPFLRPTRFP